MFPCAYLYVCVCVCVFSELTEVRFAGSAYGSHLGRVEVLFNGTWGTVCGTGWNYNSARVACR